MVTSGRLKYVSDAQSHATTRRARRDRMSAKLGHKNIADRGEHFFHFAFVVFLNPLLDKFKPKGGRWSECELERPPGHTAKSVFISGLGYTSVFCYACGLNTEH
jgi:hypothetical protein